MTTGPNASTATAPAAVAPIVDVGHGPGDAAWARIQRQPRWLKILELWGILAGVIGSLIGTAIAALDRDTPPALAPAPLSTSARTPCEESGTIEEPTFDSLTLTYQAPNYYSPPCRPQPRPSPFPAALPTSPPTTPPLVPTRVGCWWDDTAAWIQRGDDIEGEEGGDQSGRAVALSGDGTVLAVGAPRNGNNGHVRVLARDATTKAWIQRGNDIDEEEGCGLFGWSVALSNDGNVLAVGAPYNSGSGFMAGHVRAFAWDATTAEWIQRGDDIDGEAGDDQSGRSMALSGDGTVLAVGAPTNDGAGSDAGHMRVLAWDATTAAWTQRGDDIEGEAEYDQSGYSVALSDDGTVLAVGARYNDGAGTDAGHVRVLAWDATTAEWIQRGDDIDGEAEYDQSGWSVALSGDGTVLAVGAPRNRVAGSDAGHVRVLALDATTAEWIQRGDDIVGEGGGDQSGRAVALSGDGTVLAVGAYRNDGAGSNAGHVRVLVWDATTAEWIQRGDDIDGEAVDDQSGRSVALSGDGTVLAVGANGNDGAGSDAGHVRVYALRCS